MKIRTALKTVYAGVVAALLLCATAAPVCAQEAHQTFLRKDKDGHFLLSSRNDFEEFIGACRSDSSLSARLECDIVLNDDEAFDGQHNLSTFESIYEGELEDMKGFSGDFDGNGHTLTGYVSCENLPVFYIIEKEGSVHDLMIESSVFSPTYNKRKDEKTQYGASITEVNHGTIKNVTVKGSVVGKGQAAGIAGVNETTGLIEDTVFSGKITGGYGLNIKPDPGIQYAFDLVVIDNGRIVNSNAKNAIKTVGGPSTPYKLSKKGKKEEKAGESSSNTETASSSGTGKTESAGDKTDAASDKPGSTADKAADTAAGKSESEEDKTDATEKIGGKEDDFIRPEKDIIVRLVKGDTLWHLSRVYYGRGILYKNMKLRNKKGVFGGLEGHVLTRLPIGTEVLIPRLPKEALEDY